LCHLNGFLDLNIRKFPAASVSTAFTSRFASAANDEAVAVFAGGCIWCLELDSDRVSGATKTIPGYTGGTLKNFPYKDAVAARAAHREAVQIFYDTVNVPT
jgi:peptide methionine sulfoxide reductase MsrA